jgi:hypothetical protein
MRLPGKVFVMAALTAAPLMARQLPEAQPSPVSISIDSIELKDVASDRIRLEVRSRTTASRPVKIRSVRFEQMRLQNLPIYLSPIEQRLELEKGIAATLPRIPITIYFRDLDSLDPLIQAVSDGKATVSGQARADLDLSLIERVATRERDAHADMPVEVTIPVDVPGGTFGRAAALATLRAAQYAMDLGAPVINGRRSPKPWQQEFRTRYAPALVVAESRYSLKLSDGQQTDFVVRGLGFRISEDKFVLTGELAEPWRYDPDVATALQTKEASLLKESCDLLGSALWGRLERRFGTVARAGANSPRT